MHEINSMTGRLREQTGTAGKSTRKRRKKGEMHSKILHANSETEMLLRSSFPMFDGIQQEDADSICSRFVFYRYDKKEYVYLPYDSSEKIYFVQSGNVEIGYLDESGRELSIDILGRGDIFGTFLGKSFSGGFARAIDNSIIAVLGKRDFEEFLVKYPQFSYRIFQLMSQRINSLQKKLQNLVFSDVRTRICKLLCSLYEKAGDERSGQIKITLTHQDIANLVASSRETASLHLSELKKCGTIAYERKRIRVLSLDTLKSLSSCF